MKEVYKCAQCGQAFESNKKCKSRTPKYCSSKCYGESLRKGGSVYQRRTADNSWNHGRTAWNKGLTFIKTCPICGEEFATQRRDATYCSLACYHESLKKNVANKGNELTCKYCGSTFRSKNRNQIFCSNGCRADYGKANYEYDNYVEKTCPICGTEYRVKYGNRDRVYCSRACYAKAQVMYDDEYSTKTRNTARKRREALTKPLPKKYIKALYLAQNDRCIYCGKKLHGHGTIEHLKPVCKGGDNDRCNLFLSCKHCNSQKGSKDFVDYVMEYHPAYIIDYSMIVTMKAKMIEKLI